MTISTLKIGALSLVAALALGAPAYAQTIDIGANGSAGVGTDSSSASTDTAIDVSVGAPTEEETSASESPATGFTLLRSDASVTNSSDAVMDARSVQTESDLEAYAATTLRTNDSFDGVETSSDRLVLRFTEDAKLFGFIPHTVTSRVEVDANGSVTVSRPWYSFLVAGLSNETDASIEARVTKAMGDTNSSGTMSARSQALVLAEIASALGGSVDVSANASGAARTDDMSASGTLDNDSRVDVQPN